MQRRDFLKSCYQCGVAASIMELMNDTLAAQDNAPIQDPNENPVEEKDKIKEEKKIPVHAMDQRQVRNIFSYIDASMKEPVKKRIFERLGYEHAQNPDVIRFVKGFQNNPKGFFDRINRGKSIYWERLEYDPETSSIRVISRVFDRCVCAFGQCDQPPKSLCLHCCRMFHKCMFEMLLQKRIKKVRLDTAFLLGDNRCSTTIFIDGKLPLERI